MTSVTPGDDSSDLVARLRQLSATWQPKSQEQVVRETMTSFLYQLVSAARNEGRYESTLHLSCKNCDYFEGLETIMENMLRSKQLEIVKTEREVPFYVRWTVSWKEEKEE
jgi:hypothetical protein